MYNMKRGFWTIMRNYYRRNSLSDNYNAKENVAYEGKMFNTDSRRYSG